MGANVGFVEVADRVLVARYPQWGVNVGLVLGRDDAIVIDTRASAAQGSAVLDDIRDLGRAIRVSHVVNTHVHFDHTFGNIAFADATIHAHDNVGRRFEAAADHIRAALEADPEPSPEYGYTEADVADVLETPLRGPDRTFGRSATIDLGDRFVTLSYAGRGHTDGDIAVFVPDTHAVFLGDLVEESAHPSFGGDCWPLDWADTLTEHLVWVDPGSVIVPGHGHWVDPSFVERQRDEIAMVARVIGERRAAGLSLDAARSEPDSRLPYPLPDLAAAFERAWDEPIPA
ncbi:adenylyl cyclase [Intrasporangium oryzae NRRL B-24470]|uniref:Adenylyl cyclase n=1 Tax=Intrasporangium oryzae NRRL B-24470 TaxID=1386089 RepID=W9GFL2_9MICO|nr:MBL fold metallo-hydrolase [Intrasporangium oryzae]EWT02664.1 adenylyl cyclase [Intrasporangium oryzae NRRL B-24470]